MMIAAEMATMPYRPIYTDFSHSPSRVTYTPEQLDQAYNQLITAGITLQPNTASRLLVFKDGVFGNLQACLQEIAAYGDPLFFAALLKKKGKACALNPILPIKAAMNCNAGCLDVMGAHGIPLTQGIEGGQDSPSYSAPLVHAVSKLDYASLQILARYDAIHTVRKNHLHEAIFQPVLSTPKTNQKKYMDVLNFIFTEVSTKSDPSIIEKTLNDSLSASKVGVLIAADLDSVLNFLILKGMKIQEVFGPSAGVIEAASNGSADCLKILITQNANLAHKKTYLEALFHDEETRIMCMIPCAWPFILLLSHCLINQLSKEVGSPLERAEKGGHKICVSLISAWLSEKEAESLGKTKEELKTFVNRWEQQNMNYQPTVVSLIHKH